MSDPRYRIISTVRQLAIGVAGSKLITIQAVAKGNCPPAPYCVPNEIICSDLARMIRLSAPPAGIATSTVPPSDFYFCCLDFNLTGNALPPVDAARCARDLPYLSTGLILFDVLVANDDRHPANFSVDFSLNPPQMNVFDHSHALFGAAAGQGRARLQAKRGQLGIGAHCLLRTLATDAHMGAWIDRIKSIPNFFIEESVQLAVDYGVTNDESGEAVSFLKDRRDSIKDIILNNKPAFLGITQWTLL